MRLSHVGRLSLRSAGVGLELGARVKPKTRRRLEAMLARRGVMGVLGKSSTWPCADQCVNSELGCNSIDSRPQGKLDSETRSKLAFAT